MKGYKDEAKESMEFVYKGNVNEEFERMADTINNLCCRDTEDSISSPNTGDSDCDSLFGEDDNKGSELLQEDEGGNNEPQGMFSSKYRNIMVIGMGLLLAQQFSGQPCILAYSRVLFEAAGWEGHTSVVTVTIMGIVSSFTVSLVDRLGRKTLLAAGSTIMLASVSCLAYGFWGWDEDSDDHLSHFRKQLVLWSMFVFISGYQVGFGPITWTVLSEIYPTEIRGSAMALSVEVNFASKFLTQLFFPIVQGVIGWGSTFVVFACIVAAGLLFVLVRVPETKGMSLEEIQVQLKRSPVGADTTTVGKKFQYPGRDPAAKKAYTSPLLLASERDTQAAAQTTAEIV